MSALDILHSTVNALRADFAGKLRAAGHDVDADAHVDTLVASATAAAAGSGQPPTYADAALASFSLSMTHALLQFASAHLPPQFQPIAQDAAPAIEQTALDLAEHKPIDKSDLLGTVLHVAETAASVLIPGAAPVVALAGAAIEAVEHGTSASDVGDSVVHAVGGAVEQAAEAAAEKALPGVGGALAGAAVEALEKAADDALTHPGE
jgi:hypothetical protein